MPLPCPPSARPIATTPVSDPIASRLPFFYGWVMVPVAMIAQACTSPGQTFGVSVFNSYLRESLELSHTELSTAYMAGTLLASLPLSFVGALMDRHGIRKTMTGVVLLLGAAAIGTSQVRGVFSLFLAFFCLRLLGQGALSLLANNTLAMWFHRRLGLVSGIKALSGAMSLAILPTVFLAAIHGLGWRGAFVALGVSVWAILLPILAVFFRNRPEDIGQLPDGESHESPLRAPASKDGSSHRAVEGLPFREVARTGSYWILLGFNAVWGLVITAIFFSLVPFFESRGLQESHAALTFTVFAVSLASLQVTGGWMADLFRPGRLLSGGILGMLAGVVCLIALDHAAWALAFAVTFGASQGLTTSVGNTVWARFYGRAHLGKIRGSVWTATVAGSSLGPFIMGAIADLNDGQFDPALWIFVALLVPFVLLTPTLRPPASMQEAKAAADGASG